MTLRLKTILILAVTTVCLSVVLTAATDHIILNKVLQIEQNDCLEHAERISQWMAAELSGLTKTTADWSAWDEMYQFAQDANAQFVTANLYDQAIAAVGLDLLIVVGSDGAVKFAGTWDGHTGRVQASPTGLDEFLLEYPGFLAPKEDDGRAGLVMLSDGPMFVASREILTGERKGPVAGTCIMGTKLDTEKIARLSEAVRLDVNVRGFREDLDGVIFGAPPRPAAAGRGAVALKRAHERTMVAYEVFNDVRGRPCVVTEAAIPRVIYGQAVISLSYFRYAFLATAFVCGGVMLLLLEKTVLSRLARLGGDVSTIGRSGDLSLRLAAGGRDELAGLEREINAMLSQLEQSRKVLKESEAHIARSRNFFLKILDDFPNPIWHACADGKRDYFNKAWLAFTGRPLQRELMDGWKSGVYPDDLDECLEIQAKALAKREPFSMEYRHMRADGKYGWLLGYGEPIVDPDGEFAGYVGSCYDVTERKKMEEALTVQSRALANQVRRNEMIIHTAMEGYLNVGLDGRIREVNRAFCDMVGYAREELLGMGLASLETGEIPQEIGRHISETIETGHKRFVTKCRRKDGSIVDVEISTNVVRDGSDVFFVAFARDVTERLRLSEELARMAQTDQLTGIGNRRSFVETMSSLEQRRALCRKGFAFLMCDVDDFKAYNDAYGHIKGDQALASVVSAMADSLRAGDRLFRYGGEEFVVLLPAANADNALAVADRICRHVRGLAIPHSLSSSGVVTVSCGASSCRGGSHECPGWEELLKQADNAMYAAKAAGKNRVEMLTSP